MTEEVIETVMNMVFCTREEAIEALQKVEGNDPVEACTLLLKAPPTRGAPKEKKLDETQEFFAKLRADNEKLIASIEAGLATSKGQRDCSSSIGLQALPEEKALQNNCFQECQLPVLRSEVQTQETACQ